MIGNRISNHDTADRIFGELLIILWIHLMIELKDKELNIFKSAY
jgi:hypothetical protein